MSSAEWGCGIMHQCAFRAGHRPTTCRLASRKKSALSNITRSGGRKCAAKFTDDAHGMVASVGTAAAAVLLSACLTVGGAQARLEGVNKPELLPPDYTTVIDVAGFLTPGEESRIKSEVESLERDTGVKLRVLAQNYPSTPGLAVRDFWGVDEDTVVFVADPSLGGNILNFNVGGNIDLRIPRNFWTRLSSKYGTKYFWQERGEGAAIVNAVSAIDTCAREPIGKLQCSKIQSEFGEEASAGPFEKMFLGG